MGGRLVPCPRPGAGISPFTAPDLGLTRLLREPPFARPHDLKYTPALRTTSEGNNQDVQMLRLRRQPAGHTSTGLSTQVEDAQLCSAVAAVTTVPRDVRAPERV